MKGQTQPGRRWDVPEIKMKKKVIPNLVVDPERN